jgi:2-keto-myo-inositol isomerase
MVTRRQLLKYSGASLLAGSLAWQGSLAGLPGAEEKKEKVRFRFSLNTSTISGQKLGLKKYIDIAARAGYNGIELWVRDVRAYLGEGHTIRELRKFIDDSTISVEDAIGFAPWLSRDEEKRKAGISEMQSDMELMAELGCRRIAAPAAGVTGDEPLDLFRAGALYGELIGLGRRTGVMPQLEFWGASPYLFHIGQAMMICAVANDPDVHILADVFHLFRGDSGFESLNMLRGNVIEIFHMNDYPPDIPREKQNDSDRVYPGEGAAPMKKIIASLAAMGGEKVLSVELFNRKYWEEDPELVARRALEKMKALVAGVEKG